MPPRIDFYVLPDAGPTGRQLLACRLAEKAFRQGHRIVIHTDTREHATLLDDLLWTYKDISFIPHATGDGPEAQHAPVLVSHAGERLPGGATLLINLAAAVPADFEHFERVAELVDQSDEVKQGARQRYRQYRDCGCTPHTHTL